MIGLTSFIPLLKCDHDQRSLIYWLALAMRRGERIHLGAQSGQRVIGQFDPVRQVRRVKHRFLFGTGVVGNNGSNADRAGVDGFAIIGPHERGIVRGIAGIGELHHQTELDRRGGQTCRELLNEKIGRPGFCLGVAEILLPGDRKDLVTPRLVYSILIHEDERVVGEERYRWRSWPGSPGCP